MSAQDGAASPDPAGFGPIPRREDARLLTGAGRYVDDIVFADALHLRFLRSPHAHARICRIDAAQARAMAGVVAVFSGADVNSWIAPLTMAPPIEGLHPTKMTAMPVDKARFAGDLVACVIATSASAAADALEAVAVDYEPLAAVIDMTTAASSPTLVDDTLPSNRVARQTFTIGNVEEKFAAAHRIVECRFSQHRQTHLPLESRGCVAVWDRGREHLTMHVGVQAPHPFRSALAARLGLSESQVTVIAPDMGGGFGQKVALLREELSTLR